jgi:cellulose synthase/poly-beta-1,6-N-acetylglucosamine synthase-like glycosyltransferase
MSLHDVSKGSRAMLMRAVFWVSVCGVAYPYFIYPAVLWLLGRLRRRPVKSGTARQIPTVSMIVPVYNEQARIARKVANTASLRYPAESLEIIFVSDGSSDGTVEIIRRSATAGMRVVELPERRGKAAALNAGLAEARHEILVFSDASIELEPDALRRVVEGFGDPTIGCVSGEDRIAEAGGEGFYGRYELVLRRLESRVGSIVGASGSFYAQRKALCQRFQEGMAPDFLSVLRTIEQGFRAVSDPAAVGTMTSLKDPGLEFERKVRTLIRGMTTLFANARLLDPFRFGVCAFALFSHKVMRWLAPAFLLAALLSALAMIESPWYFAAFLAQAAFYLCALAARSGVGRLDRLLVGRICLYFTVANAAVLAAWFQYLRGMRQELWTPSPR